MSKNAVIRLKPLGFPWDTADPFLFCVHHEDFFPAGNEVMGPKASLEGRHIGQDLTIKDGWRMYHGDSVPGFPEHPHRGFETVTVVRKGLVDHADSMGAAGRYGGGDTQWMTAGRGVQHSEMFPLVNVDKGNTLELFQIWLNLPRSHKMTEPHFTMLWREDMPQHVVQDEAGRKTEIDVIAGPLGDCVPMSTPPDSWAAVAENHVAIWVIKMDADATLTLPASVSDLNRTLYFYRGETLSIAGTDVSPLQGAELQSDMDALLENGNQESYLLLLQGRPINEPVAQYGPFVMNTQAEIQQAFMDYQRTQFGGWPWPQNDQTHPRDQQRFAKHADGKIEEPGGW